MKPTELWELGKKLGLKPSLEYKRDAESFAKSVSEGNVSFKGANSQVFNISCKLCDNQIYSKLGNALVLKGKMLRSIELERLLNITNTSDTHLI